MTDTLVPTASGDHSPSNSVVTLPWQLVRALTGFAADEGATRAHVFHAALALVLRRFTGNDELLVRVAADAGTPGVRTLLDDAASFRDALRIVRDACEAGHPEASCLADAIAFDVLGALGCTLRGHATDAHLTIQLASDASGLGAATDSVLQSFAVFLHAVVEKPDVAGSEIELVDSLRRTQLLWRADGPRRPRDGAIALDRIVAERAALTPNAIAVVDGTANLTYDGLIARAGAIATALRRRGVEPGVRVGVCMDASGDLLATILATWQAGAVYVPLDPALPHVRLAGIAAAAGIALVVTTRSNAGTIAAVEHVLVDEIALESDDPQPSRSAAVGAAYILYTSGSTGTPKGVEISHAAAANAILAACDVCAFDARDRTLFRSAISFDLSIYDMFCSLVSGATLVVTPRSATADPLAIIDMIEAHAVTHLLLGPALLAALLDRRAFERCTALRLVTCGGEALPRSLVERFFARSTAALYNLYGPSEATMLVTLHRCTPADVTGREPSAPLGRPLANTHVSVRDRNQFPVPLGAIGEITIGGVQLATGYINAADETAKRFVNDPARPGQRLYRTGDVARLQLDGSIVFLSRNDKQVKIRGNRVEPGEVAAAIEQIPGVQTAVVCAQRRIVQELDDAFVLVGYALLSDDSGLTPAQIRERLRDTLPPYLVPIEVMLVEAFPLTVSGKIDEKALAAGSFHMRSQPAALETRSNEEFSLRGIAREQVRVIWESLLGRSDIGDYDNFFDIGGDSLLAVRLMMRLEEAFGHRVALSDFFETMTIAALAELVAADASGNDCDARVFNESGAQPPLVFLHGDFAGGSYAWSLAGMLGPDQPLTVISPHGIFGRPIATNVPAMARDVAATIERLHPVGPVRIGGYSAAGLVAFEAARLLRSAGRDVRDVMLVGTSAERTRLMPLRFLMSRRNRPNGLGDAFLRGAFGAGTAIARFARMPAPRRIARIMGAVGIHTASSERAPTLAPNELELGKDYAAYERAHAGYIPGAYAGRLTLLWPAGDTVRASEAGAGWQRVAPGVTVVLVSGSHHGCVSRHLDEIAAEMRHRFA